jgi:hypothetical protein
LRAGRHGFRLRKARTRGALALGFAAFAPFGLVFKVLVVEEVLLSRCKGEICSAINALESTILKLRHGNWSPYELELVSDSAGGGGSPGAAELFWFPAIFLPVSFAGQRLLGPELLARLQIEGMTFHLFDDVFLLNLAFEAAKGVL